MTVIDGSEGSRGRVCCRYLHCHHRHVALVAHCRRALSGMVCVDLCICARARLHARGMALRMAWRHGMTWRCMARRGVAWLGTGGVVWGGVLAALRECSLVFVYGCCFCFASLAYDAHLDQYI